MLQCWVISHLNRRQNLSNEFVDFDLLQPMHRMHPYRYDKMHERDLDFYLIEADIDQPAINDRIFHGEIREFLYGFFCLFDLKGCERFDFG